MPMRFLIIHLAVLIFTVSPMAFANTTLADDAAEKRAEYIRANYTKFEYQIPMRDGIKLFTSVYLPNDDSQTYPIMLQRTPYRVAPYGVSKYKTRLGPSERFEKEKFIFFVATVGVLIISGIIISF